MASKARRSMVVGTLSYLRHGGGKVLCHTTKFQGAMRKHGNDRQVVDEHGVKWLNAIAHRKVAPMGEHGLVIRHRKEAKSV